MSPDQLTADPALIGAVDGFARRAGIRFESLVDLVDDVARMAQSNVPDDVQEVALFSAHPWLARVDAQSAYALAGSVILADIRHEANGEDASVALTEELANFETGRMMPVGPELVSRRSSTPTPDIDERSEASLSFGLLPAPPTVQLSVVPTISTAVPAASFGRIHQPTAGAEVAAGPWGSRRWFETIAQALDDGTASDPKVRETMPREARWWLDQVDECLDWQRSANGVSEHYLDEQRGLLYRLPYLLREAGVDPVPVGPKGLEGGHIRLLRDRTRDPPYRWRGNTARKHLTAIRNLAIWSGNPIHKAKALWSVSTSDSMPARLRGGFADTVAMLGKATGRTVVLLVLMGLLGLRYCTASRVLAEDFDFDGGWLTVRRSGKDEGTGKIPLRGPVADRLRPVVAALGPKDRLYPWVYETALSDVQSIGINVCGYKPSCHAFRHELATTVAREAARRRLDVDGVVGMLLTHRPTGRGSMTRRYIDPDVEGLLACLDSVYAALPVEA